MSAESAPLAVIASALHRERTNAGLSIAELGRRSGVAKSTVSQLESGTGNPSIETLWALATALDIPFSRLVDVRRAPVQLIRAGEGPVVSAEQATYFATLLASCPPRARRDIYLISAEPGPGRESKPHSAGVVEHVIIGRGRALVGPLDELTEIGPGDYLAYPGDATHLFRALEDGTVAVLVSEHV